MPKIVPTQELDQLLQLIAQHPNGVGVEAVSQACGRLRNQPVEISGSVYLPVALPQRLEELFDIMLGMAGEIRDPFEQAFFLMVHLPSIFHRRTSTILCGWCVGCL